MISLVKIGSSRIQIVGVQHISSNKITYDAYELNSAIRKRFVQLFQSAIGITQLFRVCGLLHLVGSVGISYFSSCHEVYSREYEDHLRESDCSLAGSMRVTKPGRLRPHIPAADFSIEFS